MLKKAAALFVVLASIAMWIGCVTTSSHYVFAALPTVNQIVAYREDPNSGILTVLAGSPFSAGQTVESVVVHPSKKFLYAANSGESDISLFTISNGVLTEKTPRISVGVAPILLVMDAAGTSLYVAGIGTNSSVSIFSIDAGTGVLSATGSPIPIGTTPLNMRLSPSGNVLYVTGSEGNGTTSQGIVEVWGLTATPCGQSSPPCLVQVEPTGGLTPQGLTITPNGSFLYTANFVSNTISEFSISSSDGSLTALSASPVGETYAGPIDLRVDNAGKYLYVANKTTGNIVGYSVGSDGGLTLLATSPFAAPVGTSFVASDPSGKYLMVGIQGSSPQIQSFALDPGNGTLTSVATYQLGSASSSIAVSP